MRLIWTDRAVSDLERLHDFLASVNPKAADRMVQALVRRVEMLPGQPHLGEKIERYDPREVRRVLVSGCEIRYGLDDDGIRLLRIWHSRENRW